MFYKFFCSFFFLIFFITVKAEVINSIKISGNKRISEETIKVYGEIELRKDYSTSELNTILKKLYETNFFEDIQINLSNNNLTIEVKEYPFINKVELNGEKSNTIKKEILSKLQLQPKESFNENRLVEDVNLIKKLYSSLGYNFVEINPKTEKFDGNRINVSYDVSRGKKTYISKIEFIGNKKIKEKRLRDIIVSEEYKFWKFLSKNTFLNYANVELDKRLLLNYYKSLGYYDVQVLSNNAEIVDSNNTKIIYTINAGERFKINRISLNISDVLDKNKFEPLLNEFNKIVGKYYSPFKIKKLLDNLDILIADNDFQFVEHSVNEIIENENIEIKINIYEGPKQIIKKINIVGNNVTDEAVIRGELLLDEGDPFNKLKLDQSIARIKARSLFASVETNVQDSDVNDEKIINIKVEETPTGEISAAAGVGTAGGSFAFSVKENNWLGKGIALSTEFVLSSETFTGGLFYTDPNFNFSGNTVDFSIENTTNDKPKSGYKNNLTSLGASTRFEQYKDVYVSSGISFSYDDLKVDSSASSSLQKQKGTFSDLSFNYGISSDKRDRVYSPSDGHIVSFGQVVPVYADSPYIRNNFSLSKYHSFSPNYIGAFKFYASAIDGLNNEDVRLSKRIFLNSSRLRGFESGKIGPKDGEDYVGGNYATTANIELNLPNFFPESTKTDVGLFFDIGNLWAVDYDQSIDDSNKIRSSFGINTSWISPVGPLSFVLSQNISKAKTDVTESFNFRLGTTF
jgi:outer membrane protein insertion porin family